jgi:beta-glucosidase
LSALVGVLTPTALLSGNEFVRFPESFKWCVATSGHQIEGHNQNSDWARWERIPGKIKNGDLSGKATDHWNRVAEDAQLIADLNVGYYRMSVEWPRIEPAEGKFSREAIEHYRTEIAELAKRGIRPMITLNHFTLPLWAADRGGWEWSGMPAAFERFTEYVYRQLGADVRDWITLNEPMVVVVFGYLDGRFPPGKKDPASAIRALQGMLRSHALAYHKLHGLAAEQGRKIRVGVAHHFRIFDPRTASPVDALIASVLSGAFNWAFPDALQTGRLGLLIPRPVFKSFKDLKGTQDFIGVNYYTRDFVDRFSLDRGFQEFQLADSKGPPKTDVKWEIYPEGIYRILKSVSARYPHLPILVTENGLADRDDTRRLAFLREHLYQLSRAIKDGVRLEGYCHWSLLDNFEWAEGFGPRFGLYEVNYETLERTPRLSAEFFSYVARTGHFWRPAPPLIQFASNASEVTSSGPLLQ